MAGTISTDHIWRLGTAHTRGYGSVHRDQAVRSGFVTGLDGDAGDNVDAIDLMKTAIGDYHHSQTNLPVDSISSKKVALNKAEVIARFARSRGSIPTQEADSLTHRRSGIQSIDWWRDTSSFDTDGRPNGAITTWSRDSTNAPVTSSTDQELLRPRPWHWRFGVMIMTMPTVLSTHPSALHTKNVGKANSNTVTQFLNTGGFPSNTLYFAGFSSTPVEIFGGTRYLVEWQVIYNPRKWVSMSPPLYDSAGPTWNTQLHNTYDLATLVFPVHSVVS